MRWLAYFILAYVAIGLQIGAGEFMRIGGAKPDIALLGVIFIAMNAPRQAALLGALGIGLMHDLVALQPMGLFALAYALVAVLVVGTQEIVHRAHPLTHALLALVASLMVSVVAMLQGWLAGAPLPLGNQFSSALYTALLAVPVLGPLQKWKRGFAFSSRRRLRAF